MTVTKTEFNKIMKASKKAPVATMAYFYLSSLGEDIIMCSNTSLAAALGVSVSTASNAIKVLRDEGLVRAFKVGTSYAYIMDTNLKLPWKEGENDIFAEVPATVILSKMEQGEDGEDIESFKLDLPKVYDNEDSTEEVIEEVNDSIYDDLYDNEDYEDIYDDENYEDYEDYEDVDTDSFPFGEGDIQDIEDNE